MGLTMSELIEQLAGNFGVPVRTQAGLLLIRLQDCGKIIQACRSSGLLILGIEAFRLSERNVVPDTDWIADFSELASKQWDVACLEAARSADLYFDKAKGRTDLWFDFCLRGRE
jgi:hypothetical protein